ncbi:MAG TPA: MBL fold metallo-hydrolase [Sphingobacteriaceae bacterium]|nr:MBL fold metallo-hydrolase [Sphingobacteriaceae bacterium]
MSLFITSLNSGSNGNCYYIGNSEEGVLIDAGISCRETEKRMQRLGLSMQMVKAIFVSHEHSDHINGIPVLARKYQLPVYITDSTMQAGRLSLAHLSGAYRAYEPVKIGSLTVTAFPKLHDASEPHSFIVEYKGIKVGVFTDIGLACSHVVDHFKQCHAAFLEANYDEEMLDNGNYPIYLKNRIRNGWGHLSNKQALQLFLDHRPAFMSHLLLSHLSKNNNCPELVGKLFSPHAGNTNVVIASRYNETPVYCIGDKGLSVKEKKAMIESQLSLF